MSRMLVYSDTLLAQRGTYSENNRKVQYNKND